MSRPEGSDVQSADVRWLTLIRALARLLLEQEREVARRSAQREVSR